MNPRRSRRQDALPPAAPGAQVFNAIAWSPATRRWVRGIVGFVLGCAIPAVIHHYWGTRFPWLDSAAAVFGPAAGLALLGALLPVTRPWLRLDVEASRLVFHARGGLRREVPAGDVRMVAGEGGVDVGPGRLFWKYLHLATLGESFRLKLPTVRSQRCFADVLAACPFAIGLDFFGRVRMPELAGAPDPAELVRCALAVASKELRRQGARALLAGTGLVVLAFAGGALLLAHGLFHSIRHAGVVAAVFVAGGLLLQHGLGRLVKCRAVARKARESTSW